MVYQNNTSNQIITDLIFGFNREIVATGVVVPSIKTLIPPTFKFVQTSI